MITVLWFRSIHIIWYFICLSLSICLSVCLSVCLSICLSACLSVCMYVYLPVCVSVCLSVYLPVCVSVCLSVCLSACLLVSLSSKKYSPNLSFDCLDLDLVFSTCSITRKGLYMGGGGARWRFSQEHLPLPVLLLLTGGGRGLDTTGGLIAVSPLSPNNSTLLWHDSEAAS